MPELVVMYIAGHGPVLSAFFLFRLSCSDELLLSWANRFNPINPINTVNVIFFMFHSLCCFPANGSIPKIKKITI